MSNEILDELRENALKTTVSRLAGSGVQKVRVVRMETLERIFEKALERALQRSLARLPAPARRTFEKEAREELREVVLEEQRDERREERPALDERKAGLLEAVFQENLILQKRAA